MNIEVLKEKIGTIISSSASGNAKVNDILYIINHSKEQVEDKDWDIYEYLHLGEIYTLQNNRKLTNFGMYETANRHYALMEGGKYTINAVRIKSTGEVYKINDKIEWTGTLEKLQIVTIRKFGTDDNGIYIILNEVSDEIKYRYWELRSWNFKHHTSEEKADMEIDGVKYIVTKSMADEINQILHSAVKNEEEKQQLLLITEDDIEIYYEHQLLYGIGANSWNTFNYSAGHVKRNRESFKWFSTEAARDKYIVEHKPVFALIDIHEMHGGGLLDIKLECEIRKLAEQKLNSKQ